MQIVELSNHPGKMLGAAHRQRMDAERRMRRQHEDAVAAHERQVQEARARRDRARADRRWLDWIRAALAVWRAKGAAPSRPVVALSIPDREQALAAGVTGEELVVLEYARTLDDRWTLLRGYRNRRGEIDHLLLGPLGLVAIEVKYRNATVHCAGDSWWYEKYDRYGNMVEKGRLEDRGGRSPSRQLNEPADALQDFLDSRGQRVPIHRVVLFNHPRSRIGGLRDQQVFVATSPGQALDLLNRTPTHLSTDQVTQIKALITRDHRHHERRRPRR
jgi:Nuclease-related domain